MDPVKANQTSPQTTGMEPVEANQITGNESHSPKDNCSLLERIQRVASRIIEGIRSFFSSIGNSMPTQSLKDKNLLIDYLEDNLNKNTDTRAALEARNGILEVKNQNLRIGNQQLGENLAKAQKQLEDQQLTKGQTEEKANELKAENQNLRVENQQLKENLAKAEEQLKETQLALEKLGKRLVKVKES